jgi:hypothetical protein
MEDCDQYTVKRPMNSNDKFETRVQVVGQMPPFGEVASKLWGPGCDVDSDGDACTPGSRDWRELTLILRPDGIERIDIDPQPSDSNELVIRASSIELLQKTVDLFVKTGSVISRDA